MEVNHLKEIMDLKVSHLNEKMELIQKLNNTALNKAFDAMVERLDASNHKFSLLKEQTATFARHEDVNVMDDKVAVLYKFMWMAMGAMVAMQAILTAALMIYLKK